MDYIRKMPLLMALTGGIIVGLMGFANQVPDKENLIKIIFVMVIFYIAGYFISHTLKDILETSRLKAEEKLQEQRQLEKEAREKENEELAGKAKGQALNLVAGDELVYGGEMEDFEALPVADFIKRELNQ